MTSGNPIPIRFTEEDEVLLERLRERTGLTTPSILRLALRALDGRETLLRSNDLRHLQERLDVTIEALMFTSDRFTVASVLGMLRLTVENKTYPGLEDGDPKRWLATIQRLTRISKADIVAVRLIAPPSDVGAPLDTAASIMAERLTDAERAELRHAICELNGFLTRSFWLGQ